MYTHLAQVLHEMHAAGVIHRDIKPAFVMVVEDDYPARHPARIKITDPPAAEVAHVLASFADATPL